MVNEPYHYRSVLSASANVINLNASKGDAGTYEIQLPEAVNGFTLRGNNVVNLYLIFRQMLLVQVLQNYTSIHPL